jgi:hypothetical protein
MVPVDSSPDSNPAAMPLAGVRRSGPGPAVRWTFPNSLAALAWGYGSEGWEFESLPGAPATSLITALFEAPTPLEP